MRGFLGNGTHPFAKNWVGRGSNFYYVKILNWQSLR